MSLRSRVALSIVALLSLAFLAGCGSSSPTITPPPSGGFSNSNLNGTYVFSVSGLDLNGAPYAIVGTFTANGQGGNGTGGITGGTVDVNDDLEGFTPVADAQLQGGSSYTVGADGRGQAHLVTNTPFNTIILDFVLQDSSHGLVSEFDDIASGSGTLDSQTASITPSGSYAFSFSGAEVDVTTGTSAVFATVGNFTLGSNGAITAGLEDYNAGIIPYTGLGLSGTVVAGPSTTPATVLSTSSFGLTFDVYPIDASHLKFIEMDTNGTLSGDAYSQTSTSMPTDSTLPFTLVGELGGGTPVTLGGFMVTDGSGNPATGSSEDLNEGGTTVSTPGSPVAFTGTSTAAGNGRYTLGNFSGFVGGSAYVAYPSSAGVFLLEIDGLNIESGIAYPAQTSGATFNSAQGYGMNLTGLNLGTGSELEVDDIAEFTAETSGTISGYLDENYAPGGAPTSNIAFINNSSASSTFTAPTGGRGQIGANLNNLNSGFLLNYYVVDGTTFPFIELDGSGQISSGVLVEQNASGTAPVAAKAAAKHLFIPRPFVKAHAVLKNKKLNAK